MTEETECILVGNLTIRSFNYRKPNKIAIVSGILEALSLFNGIARALPKVATFFGFFNV